MGRAEVATFGATGDIRPRPSKASKAWLASLLGFQFRQVSIELIFWDSLAAVGFNRANPPTCHPEGNDCFALREAVAKSKDPMPACSETNAKGSVNQCSQT